MITRSILRASWDDWLAIDYRRSRAGPWWLPLLWTALVGLAIALAFTILGFTFYARSSGAWRNLAGWWHWYQLNAWVSLWIGFIIHALFVLARGWLTPQGVRALQGARRTAFYAGIPVAGVLIGVLVHLAVQVILKARARQILAARRRRGPARACGPATASR